MKCKIIGGNNGGTSVGHRVVLEHRWDHWKATDILEPWAGWSSVSWRRRSGSPVLYSTGGKAHAGPARPRDTQGVSGADTSGGAASHRHWEEASAPGAKESPAGAVLGRARRVPRPGDARDLQRLTSRKLEAAGGQSVVPGLQGNKTLRQ